jgi:Ni,Fe-hydrogenase III small subunit
MWVLRGLRHGVLTTRWPARPDEYARSSRGPAAILPGPVADAENLSSLCPAGAVSGSGADVSLDQGRCVQCGRCVSARPELFGWSAGPAAAAITRTALIVPQLADNPENLAQVSERLAARTRALRRSVHLRHVDAGSDGTEEWEILALFNPVYDAHRLGIFLTASPRHADVLLVTGSGARGMIEPLRLAYQAMPHPKIVIAVGTDAISGGLVSPSYGTTAGVAGTVPVDVWLPGSPPTPFAILHALLLALGRLSGPAGRGPAGPGPAGPESPGPGPAGPDLAGPAGLDSARPAPGGEPR